MLRTAQMLMAQGLQRDMLGRGKYISFGSNRVMPDHILFQDWRIPTNANMLRFTPEYREVSF